ncbi:hypothetical protein ALGA_2367 [Labilibaculum antarcticum]|uniref:Uncharacterized protein n=2 Tax=Labilibaculum antarcticum TaxID=1717717 RepID=A0A1Y1CK42_9BACT|nr:hypothetical protein ALGA_2367 [Labilibaculum antarcticum]
MLFEKASHVYTVIETDGNIYSWSVFEMSDLNNEILDTDIVEFISGKDTYQTEIRWKQAGEYVLVIEEVGSCQNLKANRVIVVSTATIAFKDLTSDDCADLDPQFATELVAIYDSGTELPESQYPITVIYRLDDAVDRTAIVNADKMLQVEGVEENVITETINHITIISATNKYGGTLKVVTDQEVHTRTIFALPAKPIITIIN